MKNSEIDDPLFRKAVDAIDQGDIPALEQLLQANPELVTQRLGTPLEGYFAHPYLLWFVADNPIRVETMPSNMVDVAASIIRFLQQKNHPSYQHQLDYTLGLVGTGRIPKECKVQIPLMDLLIQQGAQVNGSVLGPLGQHNVEAALYLLDKGSDYNLATAVGLGRRDDAERLLPDATPSGRYVALVVAAFFGSKEMLSMLIKGGADVNGKGRSEDFGGFHGHASPLHQAVYSGSLASVQCLVEAGADRNVRDKVYDGTPLGWAKYMQTEEKDEMKIKEYRLIEEYLASR